MYIKYTCIHTLPHTYTNRETAQRPTYRAVSPVAAARSEDGGSTSNRTSPPPPPPPAPLFSNRTSARGGLDICFIVWERGCACVCVGVGGGLGCVWMHAYVHSRLAKRHTHLSSFSLFFTHHAPHTHIHTHTHTYIYIHIHTHIYTYHLSLLPSTHHVLAHVEPRQDPRVRAAHPAQIRMQVSQPVTRSVRQSVGQLSSQSVSQPVKSVVNCTTQHPPPQNTHPQPTRPAANRAHRPRPPSRPALSPSGTAPAK